MGEGEKELETAVTTVTILVVTVYLIKLTSESIRRKEHSVLVEFFQKV